ncbi:MAG: SGNH/GDSL hydrolase family protein [Phaeodactylibacter sp.]|nr:SGNH/GDSL hydrolase family protein [Phaeodactylibacter sp.]MCB9293624.1 SGNH/GDSL hydrolase family protein [Lewinellaceae bacterium]
MICQFLYYLGALAALPVSPVLMLQGKRVRASIPELPEAGGPKRGIAGRGGHPLRLLALGESTIAGVGVASHEEGFTGCLAAFLHRATGRPVEWQVLAKSGYTARKALRHLAPLLPTDPLDLIVVGLGGNDTFELTSPRRWRSDVIQLVQAIRDKQPGAAILINNLPPVGQFPAFPASLQLALGSLVRLHGRAIRDVPALFENVYYNSRPIALEEWQAKAPPGAGPEAFFSDGVHPSGLTYRLWAEEAGAFVLSKAGGFR